MLSTSKIEWIAFITTLMLGITGLIACERAEVEPEAEPEASHASVDRAAAEKAIESATEEVARSYEPPCAKSFQFTKALFDGAEPRLAAKMNLLPREEFIRLCETMPADYQTCMDPAYAESNHAKCASTMESLTHEQQKTAAKLAGM